MEGSGDGSARKAGQIDISRINRVSMVLVSGSRNFPTTEEYEKRPTSGAASSRAVTLPHDLVAPDGAS